MIRILKYGDVANDEIFARTESAINVEGVVADIIADVRKNGDAALYKYCEKFDGAKLSSLAVTPEEIEEAGAAVEPKFLEILQAAAKNIRTFHERQVRNSFILNNENGIVISCNLFDYLLTDRNLIDPILSDKSEIEHERLKQNEFGISFAFKTPVKQHAVKTVITLRFDTVAVTHLMPCIIHSDKDAQNIGSDIDRIAFPAGIEINNAITGNTFIDECTFGTPVFIHYPGGDQRGISRTESLRDILGVISDSSAIGNGVTLKKNSFDHDFMYSHNGYLRRLNTSSSYLPTISIHSIPGTLQRSQ